MDFLSRVASGRLSEVLGEGALRTDRFMRSIGMDWGARRNADRIDRAARIESDLVTWYCAGVNGLIDTLEEDALPLEFRILGYRPERCSTTQVARVLQFMTYDLTFRTDDARYRDLQQSLSPQDYAELFPRYATINEPIIPAPSDLVKEEGGSGTDSHIPGVESVVERLAADHDVTKRQTGFGFEQGKGSNNWAVGGSRSTTGSPILAGDMHLTVSLPAIWYEVHVVTPTMNLYGVTIPGAPLPVEAFNNDVAWAFTNTGSDQIDHVALQLDDAATGYVVDGETVDFEVVLDTIAVRGRAAVIDTLRYSQWGPVLRLGEEAMALRWVAHDTSRTLLALWAMIHASDLDEFESGLRSWDSPMQNILYADAAGNIAIRSTGYLPVRRDGDGSGIIDGSRGGPVWVGRVPFDELPYSRNPDQGYLASANQEPAGSWYPYYLGHDWRRTYRGLRINELLRGKERHSTDDLKEYQSDVVAVHGRAFSRLLSRLSCSDPAAEAARTALAAWDATTAVTDTTTLLFDEWLVAVQQLAWDEPPFRIMQPYTAQLYRMLTGRLSDKWADLVSTDEREGVEDLLCTSLARANEAYEDYDDRDWGDQHGIVFNHLLRSNVLSALSRGPYAYPGYSETLSPGGGRTVTHGASWRVVVDLSTTPPRGFGVYPGGPTGNPLDDDYDAYLGMYLGFGHYPLENPTESEYFEGQSDVKILSLNPIAR
jgi:penicillin amidase